MYVKAFVWSLSLSAIDTLVPLKAHIQAFNGANDLVNNASYNDMNISANCCGWLKNGEWLVDKLYTRSQGSSVYIFR